MGGVPLALTLVTHGQITNHSTFNYRHSKMCGQGLIASMESEQQRGNITRAKDQTTIIKPNKISKLYSNNPKMCCKTFCCGCDKVVTLSGMSKHVRTWHQMTLTEYKELYGNPRKQIIKAVHHKCALCLSSILFDTNDMSKHLKKTHNVFIDTD